MKSVGLKTNEFPVLGSVYRGARVALINKFLCNRAVGIAEKPMASYQQKLRGFFAYNYLACNRVMDECPDLLMIQREQDAITLHGRMFLMAWQKLAGTNAEFSFKMRPKTHMMDHVVRKAKTLKINPKRLACNLEEDMLGKLKRIGKALRGCGAAKASQRFLNRYILYMSIRLKKRRSSISWTQPLV